MGSKKRNTFQFNWQVGNPAPYNPNTPLTGVLQGVMTTNTTIFSNIVDISNTDNQGLEIFWTGTPTGTLDVLCSESGLLSGFQTLTFNPALGQPGGSAGGILVNLNQVPWRYLALRYVNSSGSGLLTAYLGSKDLN